MIGKTRPLTCELLEKRRVLATIAQVDFFDTWNGGIIPSTDVAGITYHPPSGSLFLADSEINELSVFNGNNIFQTSLSGESLTAQYVTGNSEPTGITYNQADGFFYVTNDDARSVTRYDSNLNNPLATIDTRDADPLAVDPEGITSDLAGNLYVADGSGGNLQVLVYNSNLEFQYSFSLAGELTDAEGIAYNAANNHLFVVSGAQDKITEYTLSGSLVSEYDISGFSPAPIAAQGLTFGPTSDPNDAPSAVSLYIADGMVDNNEDGRIFEAFICGAGINCGPTANANSDQTIVLPGVASLSGSVSDDGLPGPVTPTWSKVSGPGTVSFSPNANALNATATFSAPGSYVLRLTADDGERTAFDEMTVAAISSGTSLSTLDVAIAANTDDVEEKTSGSVTLTSSDLDIVQESNGNGYTIGLRFDGLAIPQSAMIVNAYVQFQADESQSGPTSLTIHGVASDDPATFSSAKFDVTSRTKTAAAVPWEPAPWTRGDAGPAQRTANIISIVQETVSRPGWSSGNALGLVISGDGKRTAESREGAQAPILHVEYIGNQPPIAVDDSFSTDEETLVNGNVLVANPTTADSDPDFDPLTVSAVNGSGGSVGTQITLPSGALVTVNSNGTFTYDPNGQFEYLGVGQSDTDGFTYSIDDGLGGSDTAMVTVNISGANDAPVGEDDSVITDKLTVLNGDVLVANPTSPDSDVDGDLLTVTQVNGSMVDVGTQIALPSGALLTQNANGTFSYDPNGQFDFLAPGQNATDDYTYVIDDGRGGIDAATVTIAVTGINQLPDAVDDAVSTNEETVLNGDVLAANPATADSDPDLDPLTVTEVNGVSANVGTQITLSSGALLTVQANGAFAYDPNGQFDFLAPGQSTTDNYTYTLNDGNGGTDTATVTVTISGVSDAPLNLVIDPPSGDPVGAVRHSGTNTIFVGDDDDNMIYEFSLNGILLNSISTTAIASGFDEPHGMSFDPVSNNLFVADDSSGTKSIYVLTTSGQIVTVTPVIPATLNQYDDAEGLSYDASTRTLYVTFSNDLAIGSFHVENDFQLTWEGTLFSTGPLNLPNGDGADGIAYDAASGNLFLVTPEGPGSMVYEVTTSGTLVNSFHVDLGKVRGIDVLPNGHLLLSNARSASSDGGLHEYTRDGNPVPSPMQSAVAVRKTQTTETLTHSQLSSVVDAAASYWADAGQSTHSLADLTYRIVDLPGRLLGGAASKTILIDANGAGHGWFVDQTPEDNREFDFKTGLTAEDDSPAANQFDLLTVVMHEFGHVLGFADDYDPNHSNEIMFGYLSLGSRRLPTMGDDAITPFDVRTAVLGSLRFDTAPVLPASKVRRVGPVGNGFDAPLIDPQRKRALDAMFLDRSAQTITRFLPLDAAPSADGQTELRPRSFDSVSAVDQFFNDDSFEL